MTGHVYDGRRVYDGFCVNDGHFVKTQKAPRQAIAILSVFLDHLTFFNSSRDSYKLIFGHIFGFSKHPTFQTLIPKPKETGIFGLFF